MQKVFQRTLSVFLCLAIPVSCLGVSASAANSVLSTIVDLFGGNFVDRFVADAKNLAGVKSIEDTGFCIVTSYWGTRKYLNPYKLYFIFGKKGAGKTTYETKLAYQ